MVPRLRTGPIHEAVTVPASPPPTPSQGQPAQPVLARVFALTDVGRTREHNEDAFLVADLEAGQALDFVNDAVDINAGAHGALFLVADGMGGAASGELASSMASELVLSGLLERDVPGILAAYRMQGLALRRRSVREGWATLVLRRGGAAPCPRERR